MVVRRNVALPPPGPVAPRYAVLRDRRAVTELFAVARDKHPRLAVARNKHPRLGHPAAGTACQCFPIRAGPKEPRRSVEHCGLRAWRPALKTAGACRE